MKPTHTQADHLIVKARRLMSSHRQRARAEGQYLDYNRDDLLDLLRRNLCCRWCRCPLSYGDVTLDHVLPLSRGGRHALANLAVVCTRCNSLKGVLTGTEFEALLQLVGRWHPIARQDVERRLLAGGTRYATSRRTANGTPTTASGNAGSVETGRASG
jgi:hypothetical protein